MVSLTATDETPKLLLPNTMYFVSRRVNEMLVNIDFTVLDPEYVIH